MKKWNYMHSWRASNFFFLVKGPVLLTSEGRLLFLFWSLLPSTNDSWAWRKLLDLRPLALRFCRTKLGNGQSASFWFDPWTPLGQLINYIGSNGPRALRIRVNAVVADAIRDSTWSLPHPRSQQEVDLHSHLTTLSLPLSHDTIDACEWIAGDHSLTVFSSATTWDVLRPRQQTKDWVDVVWFKGTVPKLAFTMWIANYDRLPTMARLAAWGLPVSPTCAFCSRFDETRDHLMLSCDYSQDVWTEVLLRCNPSSTTFTMFTNWQELLSWIREPLSKSLKLLRKLAVQLVIFHLWKQRNNLRHNQISLPAALVFSGIDKEMRNIISANRVRKAFSLLMAKWLR